MQDLICRVAAAPSVPQLEAQLLDMQAAVRETFVAMIGPVVRQEM